MERAWLLHNSLGDDSFEESAGHIGIASLECLLGTVHYVCRGRGGGGGVGGGWWIGRGKGDLISTFACILAAVAGVYWMGLEFKIFLILP